jgi:hypothetical protein
MSPSDPLLGGKSVDAMRSMRSMRGGFIFRNRGPSLKVHHCHAQAGLAFAFGIDYEPRLRLRLSLGSQVGCTVMESSN